MEKEIELLKNYFSIKASQGAILLNDQDVHGAFKALISSIETPKNQWIEHKGLEKPVMIEGWFGVVEFRDGEKRLVNLSTLPTYMWVHTDEPDTMSHNSIEKRRKWNNEILAYYIREE